MTTKTDTEQERRDFEDWAVEQPTLMALDNAWDRDRITSEYTYREMEAAWRGYQAGRAALQSQEPSDPTLPHEQALAELVDKIIPGLDTGDLLADAKQASAALQSKDREDALDMEAVEEDLRDMASYVYQVAMSFGVSQDSFERLARDVFGYARRIEGEGK